MSFTSWHSEVPQTCVGGSWWSHAAFAPDRHAPSPQRTTPPDSGENSATPVFLQLAFTGDPAPTTCPPSRVHLTRAR
ncbi:MAG: hypothetical protein IPG81_12950 [Sandaracinaceae bacterium]|nr:hypothetical protein [Sandaracinaceae bacterium]